MRWYRDLTPAQRGILILLTSAVIIVIGLLGWNVWVAIEQARQARSASPVATPPTQKPPLPQATRTPAPTAAAVPTSLPAFDISQAGRIAFDIAGVRERPAVWETALTLVERYDMSVVLHRRYVQFPPFAIQERGVLEALGLRNWDNDRLDTVAQAGEAAAIYVPETGDLYLQRAWDGDPEVLVAQLAYAYARAFPEQSTNLAELSEGATTLDQRLTLAASGDGDAMVSLWLYLGIEPSSPQAAELVDAITTATLPYWRTEAPLRQELQRLPLALGASFAATRYAEGGTAALNEIILRPPRSTEQLLHPERYVANEEPVILTALSPTLGSGWTQVEDETIGEALLGLTLREWSQGEISSAQAENWGGDLLQVWSGADGGQVVALQTCWDAGGDASRFYAALADMLPRPLLPGLILDTTPAAGLPRGKWWAGRQGAVFLYRQAECVAVVWGNPAAAVEITAAALP